MFKRVLSILLVLTFALSALSLPIYAADSKFPDLPADHWAYNAVMTLVADGTVKGNDLGLFDPNKSVSRAEFVKMIGKSSIVRDKDYDDVSKSFWGYDYIMASGMELSGNNFEPDKPILRGETVNLLWARSGKPSGIFAPSIITDQWSNKESASWIYEYGVMKGDDGVNLRLDSTLTRAEAAMLIIRTRGIDLNAKQVNFVDVVDPALLEAAFNSVKIFDDLTYDPNKTVTNGEMAKAALRLGCDEYNLSYRNFAVEKPFEHKYATDLYILGNICIGKEKITSEFIDKPATNLDTVAALVYGMLLKAKDPVSYNQTNNYYKDGPTLGKTMMNAALTFAFTHGIELYSNGVIDPNKAITYKEIAALLVQLDSIIGTQTAITTGKEADGSSIAHDMKFQKAMYLYPSNYKNFQCILAGVPSEVYSKPFQLAPQTLNETKTPKGMYNFAREFSSMFTDQLDLRAKAIKDDQGVSVRFTFFPSLVCDNSIGFTYRIKCEILDVGGSSRKYNEVFVGSLSKNIDTTLAKGTVIYIDAISAYNFGTVPAIQFGQIVA